MSLTEIGKDTRFRGRALTPFTLGLLRHRAQGGKPVEFGWFTAVKPRGSQFLNPRLVDPADQPQLHTGLRPAGKPWAVLAAGYRRRAAARGNQGT